MPAPEQIKYSADQCQELAEEYRRHAEAHLATPPFSAEVYWLGETLTDPPSGCHGVAIQHPEADDVVARLGVHDDGSAAMMAPWAAGPDHSTELYTGLIFQWQWAGEGGTRDPSVATHPLQTILDAWRLNNKTSPLP